MLCLGYQTKWNGGATCKYGDEKCMYTHELCKTQAEYDALKQRVEAGKTRSDDSDASAKEEVEFQKKYCKWGQTCRAHKEGKCKKNHFYKSIEEFKKALKEFGKVNTDGSGKD